MDIRDYIKKSIELDKRRLEHYRKISNNIKLNGILIRKPNKGTDSARYYYRPKSGKEKYLGKADGKTIVALQHKRLAQEIYWEHKGMLSKKDYVQRDIKKEIVYNMNSIYQPHNYIVTAEGPDNKMDMESIRLIVQGWLLPKLAI